MSAFTDVAAAASGMRPTSRWVRPAALAGPVQATCHLASTAHGEDASKPMATPSWAAPSVAVAMVAAAYSMTSSVGSRVKRRQSLRNAESRKLVAVAASPDVEAPPRRPEREAPTPFPADDPFPPCMRRVLEILDQQMPVEAELLDALYEMQEIHEHDMQWVKWPNSIDEARNNVYARGCFKTLRGIVRCIGQARGRVRTAAVSLLLSLTIGGANLTRVPAVLAVECGAVAALCKAARDGHDSSVLGIIKHIAVNVPSAMLATVIDGGAIDSAINVLHKEVSAPLDQLAALDLMTALSKRAPAKCLQVGTYEAIKVVNNEALIPRRNKIMNFLRPLEHHEGPEESRPTTNIRIGGLKF